MIRLNQVFKIFLILFVSIIICFKSHSDTLKTQNDLVVLGKNEAPIKIKIFSSLTCPHCADFHINVVPKIKKEYVDPGKVQLIFIDFPLDQAAFDASKLLHCLDQKKQITFLDKIYENQSQWTSGKNLSEINNNLKEIVKVLGINSKEFDKCLNNDTIIDQIINGRINAIQKYSINSTPTIIINEKKLEGSANFRNIKKKIEKLI
tara:strand:- start:618 stop:1232 length:615 start_codon:yes stop_codon:yes gene_type:complete